MTLTASEIDLARAIDACSACAIMRFGFCLRHTCIDCGNPTIAVHGSPAMPGPCPEPGSVKIEWKTEAATRSALDPKWLPETYLVHRNGERSHLVGSAKGRCPLCGD